MEKEQNQKRLEMGWMDTSWSLKGLLTEEDEGLFQKKMVFNTLAMPTNELHFLYFLFPGLYSRFDLFLFFFICKNFVAWFL
jgi:hypothetical protein